MFKLNFPEKCDLLFKKKKKCLKFLFFILEFQMQTINHKKKCIYEAAVVL